MMQSILRALGMAFAMGWQILWPLILGFTLSAVVQAVVSHREMARLLPDDRPRTIATALALGASSSSCSYAAVAIARALFRKGADFTAWWLDGGAKLPPQRIDAMFRRMTTEGIMQSYS